MKLFENTTFAEIEKDSSVEFEQQLTERDVALFAAASYRHRHAEYATTSQFQHPVAHGMRRKL